MKPEIAWKKYTQADLDEVERIARDYIDSISENKTGFAVDTNQVTLITQKEVKELPLCSKEDTAKMILDFTALKMQSDVR